MTVHEVLCVWHKWTAQGYAILSLQICDLTSLTLFHQMMDELIIKEQRTKIDLSQESINQMPRHLIGNYSFHIILSSKVFLSFATTTTKHKSYHTENTMLFIQVVFYMCCELDVCSVLHG